MRLFLRWGLDGVGEDLTAFLRVAGRFFAPLFLFCAMEGKIGGIFIQKQIKCGCGWGTAIKKTLGCISSNISDLRHEES
jgi:hypothetical protein